MREFTKAAITEITDKDAFAKKVYASYTDFRSKLIDWSEVTEKLYYDRIQG